MSTTKRILITGTSAGFGFDAAKALAQKGHTVYATMRGVTGKNAPKADELKAWAAKGGHALHVVEFLQPGAYGTTFLGNSFLPQRDVSGEYGRTTEIYKAFSGAFEARAKAGGLGDPAEVVTAIVEEVERNGADRPLRRPVGKDVEHGVGSINQACQNVQDFLGKAFGFK